MNPGTLSGFGGRLAAVGEVTTQIINAHSSGGTQVGFEGSSSLGTREVLSGALTANVLSTALTVTGAGRVPVLGAYTKNGTSRTVRLVVEVDGVTVFDATSSAMVSTPLGIFAANGGEPIIFARSLVVRIASSLTETNNVAMAYLLHRT